jgi:nucleoside-diphosphate-sugar epimerase
VNALITGATGFVGRNLTEYLTTYGIPQLILSREELTREDYAKLDRSDIVIHLAGKAHDIRNASDPGDYDRVNFELTKQLFEAFLRSASSKFIFVSSVKAIADYTEMPLSEETIPNPRTPYGISKLKAEEFIQKASVPANKSWYILRPCMIHGPGNKGNLNLLYQLISKGLPYPLAAYDNRRSFLSVENMCFVIKELIEQDIPSGVYHVADDDALSTNELVELIALASGQRPRLWKVNRHIVRAVAKIGDFLELPLNSERLGKLVENYVVENNKLIKGLGCKLPVSAKEGIIRTIRSFNKDDDQ